MKLVKNLPDISEKVNFLAFAILYIAILLRREGTPASPDFVHFGLPNAPVQVKDEHFWDLARHSIILKTVIFA